MRLRNNLAMSAMLLRSASAFLPSVTRRTARLSGSASTRHLPSRAVAARTGLFSTVAKEEEITAAPVNGSGRRIKVLPPSPADEQPAEELPTNENDEDLLKIRHSSSHVMAMAVQQAFPEAQVTIGPWIDNGFYYDFYFPETVDEETGETVPSRKLTDQDLKKVKKAMDKIISKNYPIERIELTREEARERIEKLGEPFKLEILDSIKTEPITIYTIGDEWWDLCAGPHVESTGKLPKKAIQLQSVAGAYWRGDENREMLQRIYATAWKDPKQLKAYKKLMEEAKKRDHRMLGKKLDLFSIQVRRGKELNRREDEGKAETLMGLFILTMLSQSNTTLKHCYIKNKTGGRRRWPSLLASQGLCDPDQDGGLLEATAHRRRIRPCLLPPHRQPRPMEDLGPL